ncbi:MAG: DUF4301 family protein [Bacteroidales bacterium]|nr:DUF4301 family protein [Bacteroidales bacterium]
MFTEKDLRQINSMGIDPKMVEKQIDNFRNGFPFIRLSAPATTENGMFLFTEKEARELEAYFDESKEDYEILKFVPASGAASRMFKHLMAFKNDFKGSDEEISSLEADQDFNSVGYFFKNLKKFAFYDALKKVLMDKNLDLDELLKNKDYTTILDYLLTDKGLNYAQLPKALLFFHNYTDGSRRAFEEHLVEAAHYATDKENVARVHFTVSPEHQKEFERIFKKVKDKYEKSFGVTYELRFSQQKPSTDTVAVDMDNNPLRKGDGTLTFRPGGHGALLENLNDLDSEIIFIKNIDNIVPDRLRDTTYLYKKVIGGLLLQLQEQTFEYLDLLDEGNLTDEELEEIRTFAYKKLSIFIPKAFDGYDKMAKMDFLYNKLNRPMRIAGMVKNEGEPGGGPFWVHDRTSEFSLQIVESSQIDFKNQKQKEIVSQATHFNPVDIVCGIRDFNGKKFDLHEFVDPETGFISYKSNQGIDLKALELPGLWNGAMADWITIFVEVPLITFNPVKTINDLLRPQHQPE